MPKLVSIERIPLLRRFSISFAIMFFLPFLALIYVFVQYQAEGRIKITSEALYGLFAAMFFSAMIGYWGMRKSIVRLQSITKKTKDILVKNIPDLSEFKDDDSEVEQLMKAFGIMTQNLEDSIAKLEASKSSIKYALTKIVTGVSQQQTIDSFLELIIDITVKALDAKTGILMLLDEHTNELYAKVVYGFHGDIKNLRLRVADEGPGWVVKHRKPLLIPQLPKLISEVSDNPFIPPFLCVPLIYKEKLLGIIAVSGKYNDENFGDDELLIVSNLASQTAVAIENEKLHEDVGKTYLETVSALAIAVEARDPYSRGHLDRVSKYAIQTAQKLAFSEEEIRNIGYAAALHDIGKIGISDEVLKKEGALTKEEWEIMHKHPLIGEAIIKPLRNLAGLSDISRHHHEWINGSGYPDCLKAEEISIGAKVLSVVDSFDAMSTDRPYHKALGREEAKNELIRYIGIRYDKSVVEAFLQII